MQKFIKLLGEIFSPIIPILLIGGLLCAICNLVHFSKFKEIEQMLKLISQIPFKCLPVFIAFSATKAFGGNAYLGAFLALIMINPEISIKYKMDYQATVLPIIIMSYILVFIEKKLKKIVNKNVGDILAPILALVITAYLTLSFAGKVLLYLGNGLSVVVLFIYNKLGFIGSGILGFVYAPIVITGLHHALLPIETNLLKVNGNFITPIAAISNIAQAGSVFAVYFLEKDKKEKNIQALAGVSALLGITEPAMFGVNLKYKRAFYSSLVGSMLACIFLGLYKARAISVGITGIFVFLIMPLNKIVIFFISAIIAFGISFLSTYYFLRGTLE